MLIKLDHLQCLQCGNCNLWLMILRCCEKGLTVVRSELDHHHNITHNDSYIVCANTSSHKIQIDEEKYCSSGFWENVELSKDIYDMRNINGSAVIKYWGNDTFAKIAYSSVYHFEVNSSFYCVSCRTL